MKILPFMSKGVVLMHEDGKTFEMAPLQVFRSTGNGWTVIRIGRNTLYFTETGAFDGTECSTTMKQGPEADLLAEAFAVQKHHHGLPPEEPYFPEGSGYHTDETRAWSQPPPPKKAHH